jgi:hypothetical protein
MDWLGKIRIQRFQTLIMIATLLFIFAVTVCHFIKDWIWDLEEQLVTILSY